MQPIESKAQIGKQIVDEWLLEAQSCCQSGDWAGEHRHPRFAWSEFLDVYVQTEGRRPRVILATARDVSRTGLAFFCREPLPSYARVTVCRSGQRVGVAAKVINRTQTINGYVIGVEFVVAEPVAAKAAAVA